MEPTTNEYHWYDGWAVYADGSRRGFTESARDAKEAQQLMAQKAVQENPSISMLYVESVYRRQE